MKQYFIQRNDASRLVLFFAGWGMDEHPFRHCHPQGSDLMMCYDYRTPNFSDEMLQGYDEIFLVAWSMGVWMASQVMDTQPHLKELVVKSTAINGTLYPIDETRGISPHIFQGTLDGLTAPSLQKFQRRMCASTAAYQAFRTLAPQRPVEELKEELTAIHHFYTTQPKPSFHWDKAIVGAKDSIFMPAHQHTAWEECVTPVICTDAAHYSNTLLTQSLENYG